METNEKLIAVVEIGGDKATQFWARAMIGTSIQ